MRSVDICVMDTSMRIGSHEGSASFSRLVRDLADAASVRGRNVLTWSESEQGGWTLMGTLELTLQIPMPQGGVRRLIEPVGSRILRTTAAARAGPYLRDVRRGFLASAGTML